MTIKQKLYGIGIIGVALMISGGLYECISHQSDLTTQLTGEQYEAQIEGKCYNFILENNSLHCVGETVEADTLETRVQASNGTPLITRALDVKFYNLDHAGNDELIVLSLGEESKKERLFGEELRIYTLAVEDDEVKATLKYSNDMSAVHPWMIEAGQLDQKDAYGNIFVGVYKDTRYYKEVINRPFFLSWNGQFIERKWTGSYLSPREFKDLIFLDFTGDGCDEIAVLEKEEDGSYRVTLYKWLTFGFEYLMTSKQSYKNVVGLKSTQAETESPTIWVDYKKGCEAVTFK